MWSKQEINLCHCKPLTFRGHLLLSYKLIYSPETVIKCRGQNLPDFKAYIL